MYKITLTLAVLSFIFTAQSQIKITEIQFTTGYYQTSVDASSTLADFSSLNPSSTILSQDLCQFSSGYPYYGMMSPFGFGGVSNSSSFQSLQIGLKLPTCKTGILRVGLANFSNTLMNNYWSYNESHTVDTLVSSQNGSMVYVDSTISKSVYGSYGNQQLRLDVAYVLEMNAGERWSFSSGLGMSVGLSYRSESSLIYDEYTNSYAGYGGFQGTQTNLREREVINQKMAWGMNLYVPLGINYKLGTKRAFWKPWVLYTEFRPQLAINSIPTLGAKFSPGIGLASGIRYTLPTEKR